MLEIVDMEVTMRLCPHRVCHHPLHEPFGSGTSRGGAHLRTLPAAGAVSRRRRNIPECPSHLRPTVRTARSATVRHVLIAAAVVVAAAFEEALWQLRRERRQQERASAGGCGRWHDRGLEECFLLRAGQDEFVVEILHAGVEVAKASAHGLLSELADDRCDREGEKREEEVHNVLICLSKQHAIFLGVDKELHAKRGGGCHSSQRSQLSFLKENIWLLENSDNLTQSNGHHVHNQDVYI